jgi:hypothetical protein
MKANRILRSLAELSPELLATEPAMPEQITPQQTQMITPEKQLAAPLPHSVPTGSNTRECQHWGINE